MMSDVTSEKLKEICTNWKVKYVADRFVPGYMYTTEVDGAPSYSKLLVKLLYNTRFTPDMQIVEAFANHDGQYDELYIVRGMQVDLNGVHEFTTRDSQITINFHNSKIHSQDGNSAIIVKVAGKIITEEWWTEGRLNREILPAVVRYDLTGKIVEREWLKNGKRHRDPINGAEMPAIVTDCLIEYYIEGNPHRTDKVNGTAEPASVTMNGSERTRATWCENGKVTRDDMCEINGRNRAPPASIFKRFDQFEQTIVMWWCHKGSCTIPTKTKTETFTPRTSTDLSDISSTDLKLHKMEFVAIHRPYGLHASKTFRCGTKSATSTEITLSIRNTSLRSSQMRNCPSSLIELVNAPLQLSQYSQTTPP